NDQLRLRKLLEKPARRRELPRPRPLGQVSADHQQRRGNLHEIGSKRVGDGRIDSAKMQVGNMRDRSHQVTEYRVRGGWDADSGELAGSSRPPFLVLWGATPNRKPPRITQSGLPQPEITPARGSPAD